MQPSTRHPALRTLGYRGELSAGTAPQRPGKRRFLSCRSHHTPSGRILCCAVRRTLISNNFDPFTASTLILTNHPTKQHQDKAKVSGALQIHRGLTLDEEPAPMVKAFGDDE